MTETVNSEILKNDNEVCADKGIPEIGKIISSMPKETLKSLLYLAAGKHDSNTKLFKRPIVINNNDISELNDLVQQKLTQHQTPVSLVNVAISYKANRSVSFGTWKEFEQYKWNIPDVVEHINIKWDFFVKWPIYAIPQRHTLSVKIVSKLNPMQMMQALFSKDPDEMEDIELNLAPVVCRVDFIDHLLSEELINIVKKWVEARREPDFITTRNSFLKKNKTSIARAIHHSIPVFSALAFISFIYKYSSHLGLNQTVTVEIFRNFIMWLFVSCFSVVLISTISKIIALKAYESIDNYGFFSTFLITNGDKNQKEKNDKKNSKHMRNFIGSCSVSLLLNISAGIITYYIFKQ